MEGCGVIEALVGGDREARVSAAREVIEMASRQRQKLAEKGVIAPLILMMGRGEDEGVVGVALYALLSLAFGSERNKVRIVKCGAVPVLCEMLGSSGSLTLMEQAVTGLMILSSCSANKATIAASGAVQLLADILGCGCYLSEQAKLDAISTLHNLSTCPHLIPTLVSSGVVSVMVGVLFESDKCSEMAEKAAELVEKLVSSDGGALQERGGGAQIKARSCSELRKRIGRLVWWSTKLSGKTLARDLMNLIRSAVGESERVPDGSDPDRTRGGLCCWICGLGQDLSG
uniref:Uncharacterized protein n=1 Tax=Kalanchoe fedtschenkoi TaxID=63787 RepID=A0A7N0REY0_KALFE